MKVKELRKSIENVPDEVSVAFCTYGNNPYDDFWEVEKIVRFFDISNGDYDRICLMAKG